MKRIISCFLLPALLLGSSAAAKTVKLTPRTGKITIDGKLSEKIWQRKADVEKFYLYGPTPQGFKPVSNKAHLAFDDQFIYVAVRCEEPFMNALSLKGKKTDDPVWKDDSVEIFFVPSLKNRIYTQIVINADGIVFDLCCRELNGPQDLEWNSETICKTFKGKNYWTLEAAIPLKNLPVDAPAGDWKFHIARNRTCRGELYSFVEGIDSFHNFERFFTLAGVRIPSLKLTVTDYDMGEARYGKNRAKVTLKNWSDSKINAVIANKTARRICPIEKNASAVFTIDWEQPIDSKLCDQEVTVSADGKLLRRLTLKKELEELFINERAAVRFLEPNKAVHISVPIYLTALTAPEYTLSWSVTNGRGKEMVSGLTAINNGKALLRIFWSFMKEGSYKLKLDLCRKGKVEASVVQDLRLINSPFTGI